MAQRVSEHPHVGADFFRSRAAVSSFRYGTAFATSNCASVLTLSEVPMGLILLIILIVLLLGAVPVYPHSRAWGYGPSGLVGLLLIVLIILLLFRAVPWGY